MASSPTSQPRRRRLVAGFVGVLAVASASVAAGAPAHAQTSTLCNITNAQPNLGGTSTGLAVEQAQCELNWAYAYGHSTNYGNGAYNGLTVDGDFGQNTLAATMNFQRCAGITADGVIGPVTWSKLNYWVNQPNFC